MAGKAPAETVGALEGSQDKIFHVSNVYIHRCVSTCSWGDEFSEIHSGRFLHTFSLKWWQNCSWSEPRLDICVPFSEAKWRDIKNPSEGFIAFVILDKTLEGIFDISSFGFKKWNTNLPSPGTVSLSFSWNLVENIMAGCEGSIRLTGKVYRMV